MDSSSATPGPCVIASVNYASTVVPLFHAAWLFALGIASTKAFWIKPSWILIALVLLSVLCGLAAVRAQRVAIVPVALLWLLVGAWCGQATQNGEQHQG